MPRLKVDELEIASYDKIFLYGNNVLSQRFQNNFSVAGFIIDECSSAEIDGLPVVNIGAVSHNDLLVCCAGGMPKTQLQKVQRFSFDYIHIFDLMKKYPTMLGELPFNEGFSDHFESNKEKFNWLRALFADELSKELFDSVMELRNSMNVDLTNQLAERQNEQYFEGFLPESAGRVFYDVGGYDGFTSAEFVKRYPNFSSVHIFEPERENRGVCQKRFSSEDKVSVHFFGLGRENATVRFSGDGSSSVVSDTGDQLIQIRKLDDLELPPPSFIKMDIEGAELEAIIGAKSTIAKFSPTLAIAGYHGADHLWRLTETILDLQPNYAVFLRHYTESIYETVLFFCPIAEGRNKK